MAEIYTEPFIATTNAIIASSDCNAGYRGNIKYFRQFLVDPDGANQWLQSTGTDGADWIDRATAVLAALGYTPVNRAGDTMSGFLNFDNPLGVRVRETAGAGAAARNGISMSSGNQVVMGDLSNGTIVRGSGDTFAYQNPTGTYNLYHTGNLPAGAAPVPSGAIVAFETLDELTAAGTGWSRYTAADGRLLIGAGTTDGQTFTEATNYGSTWSPTWPISVGVSGSATGGASDKTGGPSATSTAGGGSGSNVPTSGHDHTLNGVSLSVSGTASGNTTAQLWLPISRAVVWGRKS